MLAEDAIYEEVQKLCMNFSLPSEGERFTQKVNFLWEEFKAVETPIFRRACRWLLDNCERFPRIAEFKAAINSVMGSTITRREAPAVACLRCDSSGYVSAYKRIGTWHGGTTWGNYVFRCSCQNGAVLARGIPVWDENAKRRGFVTQEEYLNLSEREQEENNSRIESLKSKQGITAETVATFFGGQVLAEPHKKPAAVDANPRAKELVKAGLPF